VTSVWTGAPCDTQAEILRLLQRRFGAVILCGAKNLLLSEALKAEADASHHSA